MSDEKRDEKSVAKFGEHGIELTDLRDAFQYSQYVVASGLAPSALNTPEKVLVAVQTGMEAGLKPMAALRSIYVVGGSPAWRGDAALGLVRASGQLAVYRKRYEPQERFDGDDDDYRVVVTLGRKGDSTREHEFTYSIRDARAAKLLPASRADGVWAKYPKRMMYYRALGPGLRDLFSDILGGMHLGEELEDRAESRREIRDVTPGKKPGTDALFNSLTSDSDTTVLAPEAEESKPDVPGSDSHTQRDNGGATRPLVLTPKPAKRTLAALAAILGDVAQVLGLHLRVDVGSWSKDQRLEAWEWAWEEKWRLEAIEQNHHDQSPNPMAMPDCLIATPEPTGQIAASGLCGKAIDLDGTACGEAKGHGGPCQPL